MNNIFQVIDNFQMLLALRKLGKNPAVTEVKIFWESKLVLVMINIGTYNFEKWLRLGNFIWYAIKYDLKNSNDYFK